MTKRDKYLRQRLFLGKNQLIRTEKEALFAKVYGELQKNGELTPQKHRLWGWRLLSVGAAILLLSGAFWLYQSMFSGRDKTLGADTDATEGALESGTGHPGQVFTPKGSVEKPAFMIRCAATQSNSCRAGDTLGFRLNDRRYPYFAAFAVHKQSGHVIWYFPKNSGDVSMDTRTHQDEAGWLTEGIYIDKTQSAGDYEVIGIASQRPLSRPDIKLLVEHQKIPDTDYIMSSVQFFLDPKRSK